MGKTPVLLAVLGLPLLIAALVFGPAALDLAFHRRPPERFLVPAGYRGWVRVDFKQKDAPPLPMEDGRRLIKLNTQGQLRTSSDPISGHGKDDFFYYDGEKRTPLSNAGVCKGGMIWQVETMVDDHTAISFARFYVGTEEQFRQVVDPANRNWPGCE
jgi:hypothetical protein